MFAAFPIKNSNLPISQASLSSVLFLKHSPSMVRWHTLHISFFIIILYATLKYITMTENPGMMDFDTFLPIISQCWCH